MRERVARKMDQVGYTRRFVWGWSLVPRVRCFMLSSTNRQSSGVQTGLSSGCSCADFIVIEKSYFFGSCVEDGPIKERSVWEENRTLVRLEELIGRSKGVRYLACFCVAMVELLFFFLCWDGRFVSVLPRLTCFGLAEMVDLFLCCHCWSVLVLLWLTCFCVAIVDLFLFGGDGCPVVVLPWLSCSRVAMVDLFLCCPRLTCFCIAMVVWAVLWPNRPTCTSLKHRAIRRELWQQYYVLL